MNIQNSFTLGSVSPYRIGNVNNVDENSNSASNINNFIISPEGALSYRAGYAFIDIMEFYPGGRDSTLINFDNLILVLHKNKMTVIRIEENRVVFIQYLSIFLQLPMQGELDYSGFQYTKTSSGIYFVFPKAPYVPHVGAGGTVFPIRGTVFFNFNIPSQRFLQSIQIIFQAVSIGQSPPTFIANSVTAITSFNDFLVLGTTLETLNIVYTHKNIIFLNQEIPYEISGSQSYYTWKTPTLSFGLKRSYGVKPISWMTALHTSLIVGTSHDITTIFFNTSNLDLASLKTNIIANLQSAIKQPVLSWNGGLIIFSKNMKRLYIMFSGGSYEQDFILKPIQLPSNWNSTIRSVKNVGQGRGEKLLILLEDGTNYTGSLHVDKLSNSFIFAGYSNIELYYDILDTIVTNDIEFIIINNNDTDESLLCRYIDQTEVITEWQNKTTNKNKKGYWVYQREFIKNNIYLDAFYLIPTIGILAGIIYYPAKDIYLLTSPLPSFSAGDTGLLLTNKVDDYYVKSSEEYCLFVIIKYRTEAFVEVKLIEGTFSSWDSTQLIYKQTKIAQIPSIFRNTPSEALGIVCDGKFIKDVNIKNDMIIYQKPSFHVAIGLKYIGNIYSYPLYNVVNGNIVRWGINALATKLLVSVLHAIVFRYNFYDKDSYSTFRLKENDDDDILTLFDGIITLPFTSPTTNKFPIFKISNIGVPLIICGFYFTSNEQVR